MDKRKTSIDRLFAEGTEREFAYNPDAWSLLEVQLDARVAQRRSRKRYGWLLLLLPIAAMGTYYWAIKVQSDAVTAVTLPAAVVDRSAVQVEADAIIQPSTTSDDDRLSPVVVDVTSEDTQAAVGSTAATALATEASHLASGPSTHYETEAQEWTHHLSSPAASPSNQSTGVSQSTIARETSTATTGQEATTTLSLSARETTAKETASTIDLLPTISASLVGDRQSLSTDQQITVVPLQQRGRRLSISVLAGPEWSVLSTDSAPRLGSRVGLRLGYQLHDRWTIQAGVTISKKYFAGAGETFDNPDLFTDALPMRMEGKSTFVEIPITIAYRHQIRNGAGLLVEGGLTNFNHRSEWYGFEYAAEDQQPGLMDEIPNQKVNKLALGAARLSIGYSTGLTSRSEMTIAPYLQIPVRGIGAGNVSIYNAGIEIIYTLR